MRRDAPLRSFRDELTAAGAQTLEIAPAEAERALSALSAFDAEERCTPANTETTRIISGHINTTYCVMHSPTRRKFIVQKINTIFDIAAIDINLRLLERAQEMSRTNLPRHWQLVAYLNAANGGKIHYDAGGDAWRVMRYVPGEIRIFNRFSEVPAVARGRAAYALGEAIAIFGRMLEATPAEKWREPLPNFHNIAYHLEYFRAVLRGEEITLSLSRDTSRKVRRQPAVMEKYAERIAVMVEKIERRAELSSTLDGLGCAVAHNDTKLNNFVFRTDERGELVCVCLIDLDTVQPGNVLDDLGDALRFAGNPVGEEPPCLDDVVIDKEIVDGIISGYLARVEEFHGAERARQFQPYAVTAFKLFLYLQSLRFFTDGLVGNAYWQMKPGLREDINIYRGEVQMRALELLEKIYGES